MEEKKTYLTHIKEENFKWIKEQKADSGLSYNQIINLLIEHAKSKHLEWSDLIIEIKNLY